MRFKLTLFLIVANLITFALIWQNSGGDAETEISAQSLFSADITEIDVSASDADASFALERRERGWFLKKPFNWRADAFAVNRLLSELRFLDNSLGFSVEEVAGTGNTLSSYGLENPAASVSVKDLVGTHELKIGKTTPDGRSVYVLSPDGKHIIPAPISLLNAIAQQPNEFRAREVFGLRPYEVRAVTVRTAFSGGNEQRVGIVRTRGNQPTETATWRFETPVAADANAQLVEKQLGDLTALSYVRFVSNDATPDEKFGLKIPVLRFTLESANRSRTLLIGNPDPADSTGKTLFAKLEDNPAIFTVPAETVNVWKTAARDLRDPYFLRFNPANLSSIKIHDGNKTLVLHRLNISRMDAPASEQPESPVGAIVEPRPDILNAETGAASNPLYNAWQMPVAPGSLVTETAKAEPQVVAKLVEGLRDLRATRAPGAENFNLSAAQRRLCEAFVADTTTPEDIAGMKFNAPLRVVDLEFILPNGKTQTQTLTIAPAVEKDTPVHAQVGTAIYSITPEILNVLDVQPTFFRDRNVYALPAGGKIVAFKIFELNNGKETLLVEEKCPENETDWSDSLEKNPEPYAQTLAKLLRSTENVVAESYLPVPFSLDFKDTSYLGMNVPEPWFYKLEVEVLLADGTKTTPGKTETLTYYLTRRLGGTTQIAGAPAQNCIFRIRQDFIDAIHALTFNRSGIIPNISAPPSAPTQLITPAK